jgi:hypothetical protein
VHYQAELALKCTGSLCSGDFPQLGRKRRLNVTRMTCLMRGSDGSTYDLGRIELLDADGVFVLEQFLPVDFSSSNGQHTLNRAVDIQVLGKQHLAAFLFLSSGTAGFAFCTASGTLDILQKPRMFPVRGATLRRVG